MKVLLGLLLPLSVFAHGRVECDKDKEGWMSESAFREHIAKLGYKDLKKDKVFKTKGNCYEIYATNAEGKKVEVHFHPETGAVIRSKDL